VPHGESDDHLLAPHPARSALPAGLRHVGRRRRGTAREDVRPRHHPHLAQSFPLSSTKDSVSCRPVSANSRNREWPAAWTLAPASAGRTPAAAPNALL